MSAGSVAVGQTGVEGAKPDILKVKPNDFFWKWSSLFTYTDPAKRQGLASRAKGRH